MSKNAIILFLGSDFVFLDFLRFVRAFIVFLDPWTYLIRSGLPRSSFSMSRMSQNVQNPSREMMKLFFGGKSIFGVAGTDLGCYGTFETWKMKIGAARIHLNRSQGQKKKNT